MSISRASNPSKFLVAVFATAILVPTAAYSLPLGQADAYVSFNGTKQVATIDVTLPTLVVSTISGLIQPPRGLAVSADGNTVYAVTAGAQVYPITGGVIGSLCGFINGDPEQVAVTPDGSKLVVPSNDEGAINQKVWFIPTLSCSASKVFRSTTFSAVMGSPFGVTIADNGTDVLAYITHRSTLTEVGNQVTVWNTATNALVGTITVGTDPQGITASPTGDRVYVANSGGGSISVIDTTLPPNDAAVIDTFVPVPAGSPQELTVNGSGTVLYATLKDTGVVAVIDTNTGAVINNIALGNSADLLHGISFSADGTAVVVAHLGTNTISVIDPTGLAPPTAVVISTSPPTETPFYVAAQPLAPDNPPSFDAGTPCAGTVTAPFGDSIGFLVTADDDRRVTLFVDTLTLPAGASMTPSLPQTADLTVNSTFSWLPSAG